MRLSLSVVRNMHLLDDVHLIESEVLVPPTASTFKRSIKVTMYEHSDSWNKLCNSSWEYDQKPSLEENCGKITDFFGDSLRKSRSRVRTRLSGTLHC